MGSGCLNLLFTLILCFMLIQPVQAACQICDRTLNLLWPVANNELASDALDSVCSTNTVPGHWGSALLAADGEQVYAAFDGTIQVLFEPPSTIEYHLGRYVRLISDDGKYDAIYGHLMDEGLQKDGTYMRRGQVIGYAGGGQDHINRGASPGPRLYFELYNLQTHRFVDPFTCTPNTCKYWYLNNAGDQCVPNLRNTANCRMSDWNGDYNLPSYSCVSRDGTVDNKYFAKITIDDKGSIDLTCSGGGWFSGTDEICKSDVFDNNMIPMIGGGNGGSKSLLNCFLKFIRVYGDGSYRCGQIVGNNVVYPFSQTQCDDIIVSIGVDDVFSANNVGLQQLMVIEGGEAKDAMKYVLIGYEYEVIGVNDRVYINEAAKGRDIFAVNKTEGTFHTPTDPYHIDFTLVRRCDLAGKKVSADHCKVSRLESVFGDYKQVTAGYNIKVREGGYKPCEYIVYDTGKFYDSPGFYLSKFWITRLASNKGFIYYS